MLRTWGRVYAKALLPFMHHESNPTTFEPLTAEIPAPDAALVAAYAEWCGAGDRYGPFIPPHMFCQWGLPQAIRVIEQSRYDVAAIINQGVRMCVHGPLPQGRTLLTHTEIVSLEEDETRASLAVRMITGTRAQPELVEAVMYSTFLLAPGRNRNGLLRSAKVADAQWQQAGRWQAVAGDGFRFALLTGDFNPIHWMESAGKKSPFGGTVLQGFGALARSYECLRAQHEIAEIEVQFQRPVLMPSGLLDVEYTPQGEGWFALRLRDGDQRVRLSGRFR